MSGHDVVSVEQLTSLAQKTPHAISIYVGTDPTDAEHARTSVKSAVDRAIREVRETGISHNQEEELRAQWAAIEESDIWRRLSRSIALFLSLETHEVFVLPNALDDHVQTGEWFNLGPLLRSAFTPQEAFALTLSADGWQLWHATATARAVELETDPDHPTDVADATNRATVRDRGHVRRLVGDEGQKVLLEKYAARVHEAATGELNALDKTSTVPLYVFGVAPVLDMYLALGDRRPVYSVNGASDQLTSDRIDEAIRERLPEHNEAVLAAGVEQIRNAESAGLAAQDLAEVAKAAYSGAVDVLIYDFTADVQGELDPSTGDVTFEQDGHDLLSQIALEVLRKDGRLIPVRAGDVDGVTADSPVLAKLRYSL